MQTDKAEASVILALLYDLSQGKSSAVRTLLDDYGITANHFQNQRTREFYQATVSSFLSGSVTFADVMARIEAAGGDTDGWADRYGKAEVLPIPPDVRTAAAVLDGRAIAETAKGAWTSLQRSLSDPLSARSSVLGFADFLSASAGTVSKQETRPSGIMEEVWSQEYTAPVPTGLDRLDKAVSDDTGVGGFQRGHLWMIGAPTGHGKSSLTSHIAAQQVRQHHPVVIHSFEMQRWQLLARILCNLGNTTMSVIRNPKQFARSKEEYSGVQDALAKADMFVRVYDAPTDMAGMRQRMRRHSLEWPGQQVLHVIDHMRRLDKGGDWKDSEDSIYAMQDMAKEYNVCIVVFSQVSPLTERELRNTNRTDEAKFFASSAYLQAVDAGLFICIHNGQNEDGSGYDLEYQDVTCFQLHKWRHATAVRQDYFMLRYDKQRFRYTEEVK